MMTISKERIERAARAMCDDAYGPDYYDDCDDENVRGRYNEYALAALEADAPALLAEKIEGLREAALMIHFNEECSIGGSNAVQERHEGNVSGLGYAAAIDARIAVLQAEIDR